MATNRERLRFATQQLKNGRYRELLQLAADKMGVGNHSSTEPASRFGKQK